MAVFSRKTEDPAIADYKAAKAALNANQARERAAGIDEETDEYRRLNARVNELMPRIPWRRR